MLKLSDDGHYDDISRARRDVPHQVRARLVDVRLS